MRDFAPMPGLPLHWPAVLKRQSDNTCFETPQSCLVLFGNTLVPEPQKAVLRVYSQLTQNQL